MSINKVYLWHISLYEFHKNKNATAAIKTTSYVYSRDAVNGKITRLKISKLRSGNFLLTYKYDDDMLLAIIIIILIHAKISDIIEINR